MRFGEIEVDESRIIRMRRGILGFESLKRYALLVQDKKTTPFCWLQSVDDGAVAFVVINPFTAKPAYDPLFSDGDMRFLEIRRAEEVALLAIVTIRTQPFSVSVNLRAPLVVNVATMTAEQVVLDDPAYPVQYFLGTGNEEREGGRRDRERVFDVLKIGQAVAL